MRKIIILAILFLALLLASAAWAAHHNSLSIEITNSMGPGVGTHGPSILMETSGYILNETGGTILLDP